MSKGITYFVSYVLRGKNGSVGFGHASFLRDRPILCMEDIGGIQDLILGNDKSAESVVIMGWRRFEEATDANVDG